ncbi:MAG: right-handed parallel beta-helix repeat-containing protein, partial [Sedimentisphaerales bacterium]|nr:right-handed parallel beta-helix repeat-containing protein [Sedimentisphaerales bacterium]
MAVRHLARRPCVALVFIPVLLCSRVTVGAVPTGNAGTISLTWTFDPASLDFEREREYTRISLRNGYSPEVEPGRPCLPALSAYVLLPSGASVSDIRAEADEFLLLKDVLIYPTQPLRTTNDPPGPFTPPDPAAYSSMEKMPTDIVCVLGMHRWHGRTLAALRLNPVRYIAGQGALYFASRIEVELTYEGPAGTIRAAGHRSSRGRSAVMDLVANPQDMDRFEPMDEDGPTYGLYARPADIQAAADDTAVYLLITSEALAPAFQPLVDRRTAQGKPGKLVTTEWISAHYAGTRPAGGPDEQTKIRNCIIDHYANHGTTWVCLAGDDTIIPLRYVPIDNPTDMYYACLNGTYDEDHDGVYGEASEDDADLLPEVWIGRIPVRTADQATAYIAKLVGYEASPPNGFANTMLIGSTWDWYMSGLGRPAGYWDHDPVDESECGMRNVYRKTIQPYWQATPIDMLLPTFSSWDEYRCGDYKLTYDHMVSALNHGYHHVYLWGHGLAWAGAGLDRTMADRLTNANRPSIFLVNSCSTAALDWEEPCVSEAMIRCPQGGGIAYIGATRTENANFYTAEFFYTEVFANKRETLGEAFARSKMSYAPLGQQDSVERHHGWVFNLHGDPALLFPGESSGRALQMLSPKGCEVIEADSDVTIRWNASGTDFQEGEVVRLEYSADGGESWLPVPGAEVRPFNGRLFFWENPGLATGSRYRTRVISVSDPSVSSASGRDFRVTPLRILTVRSTLETPRFWVRGTHANQTDYTFTMIPRVNVSLTATLAPWANWDTIDGYGFMGWLDGNGNRLTRSTTFEFVANSNRTLIAHYVRAETPRTRVYYVNDEVAEDDCAPGDDDDNDGTTPATPVRHIQQILDRYNNIATIHVSAGIYVENIVITASHSGLTLEGAGADLAIIDGNRNGSCLTITGAGDVTIRGFTLRNGDAEAGGGLKITNSPGMVRLVENVFNDNTAAYGGAIEGGNNNSISITNNRFQGNRASQQGGAIIFTGNGICELTRNTFISNTTCGHGGAVYVRRFDSLLMEENTVEANSSAGGLGGGVAIEFCNDVKLTANTFTSNTMRGNGGGASVWNAPDGSLTLTGNTFHSNVADSVGGGLMISGIGQTAATENHFFDNRARVDGGGIYLQDVGAATVSDCNISGNRADRWGGALFVNSSCQVVLSANRLTANTAGSDVAAIHFTSNSEGTISGNVIAGNQTSGLGGGIDLWNSTAQIRGNLICANSAGLGAGVSLRSQSQATLSHNTIVGNTVSGVGGAVYCENSSPTISHCILWGNSPAQIHLVAASPTVTFCDV